MTTYTLNHRGRKGGGGQEGLKPPLICTQDYVQNNLIRLYLTIPMNCATVERTFSSFHRLKKYLRSTMTQEQLNHVNVMLLHTYKDCIDNINLLDIAKEFVSFNNKRIHFLVIFDV